MRIINKLSVFGVLPSVFGLISPVISAQGIPDHTVQCNCEQIAIVAPSPVTGKAASDVDVRTNIWITSRIKGNMSVFANSPDAWCKAIPGPYVAYDQPTMPINYPITIQCHSNPVIKQSSIAINVCTPMLTCQSQAITLNISAP
jgi:hypothetical protein